MTLPAEIRRRYELRPGDEVGFRMGEHSVLIVPLKKRPLSTFRGVLPATRPFIGVEAIRQEVAQHLGRELEQKIRDYRLASMRRRPSD